MKTCLSCKTVFNNSVYSSRCPIESCKGQLIDIDNDMVDIIYQLNAKGYYTIACSSGNTSGKDLYISFIPEIGQKNIENLPSGFTTEYFDDESYISLKYSPSVGAVSKIQELNELMNAKIELLKWVEKLPDIEIWDIKFSDLSKEDTDILEFYFDEILKTNPHLTIDFMDFDNFEVGFSLAGTVDLLKQFENDLYSFTESKGLFPGVCYKTKMV